MEKTRSKTMPYKKRGWKQKKNLTLKEFMKEISSPMRCFRIDVDDPNQYEDNWDALNI